MKTFKTKAGTELPLLDLRGKDYLVVAQRLVWFREEHPDWSIETEINHIYDIHASIGKATIKDASGRIMATSHKFEDSKGFQDYIEKSETGAIGRALALCGYGTQFAPDLDEGERIVDSPLEYKKNGTHKWIHGAGVIGKNGGYLINPNGNAFSTEDRTTIMDNINAALCDTCGTGLKLSKSQKHYYCPNFKDTSSGEHSTILADQIEEFKRSREDLK